MAAGAAVAACQCGGLDLNPERFACTNSGDCAPGWSCVQGLCAQGPASDGGGGDAGPVDGGVLDSGAPDAGSRDSGTADGGAQDGGAADAGSPDAGVDAGCAGGLTLCDGGCVDLASSTQDCGACGNECLPPNGGAATCSGSQCLSACPVGESACGTTASGGGDCTTLNTTQDCGACGNSCFAPSGGTVSCGVTGCLSACPPGLTLCGAGRNGGGACVDVTSDPNNCGSCGVTCGSGLCGSALSASMQAPPSGWQLNGTATYDGTDLVAVLTVSGVQWQGGSVLYANPIVTDDFVASFEFLADTSMGRADGLAFIIEQNGPTAVGSLGGGLAIGGLTGYGVEFDLYDNGECGDADDNHAAIDQLGACDTTNGNPTPVQVSPDLTPTDIGDGAWHTVSVQLSAGTMSATLDGNAVLSTALPGYTPGNTYYFGIAGATGGVGSGMSIRNVQVTFPTARCL